MSASDLCDDSGRCGHTALTSTGISHDKFDGFLTAAMGTSKDAADTSHSFSQISSRGSFSEEEEEWHARPLVSTRSLPCTRICSLLALGPAARQASRPTSRFALALRQAAQEDVAAAQLERCAALEEAQNVDLDCHRQETSADQHSFRATPETQLMKQLAALSALALRQAAQASAAAAQLGRCAARQLGLQAALEGLTANLQSFWGDLYASLAGHKEEHEGCLREFMEVRPGGLSVLLVEHPATLQSFIVEHKAHLVDHTEAQNMDLDSHRQETAAVLHGFRDELEACG